ncbi:serine/threonine protein kinase [Saccharothrix sp. HUAS TT1]|uniref:serine/threonine protein kinase n=1 Tax=unclassified Saccharothrix TaxID=2593673 RepID=UPI00345B619F
MAWQTTERLTTGGQAEIWLVTHSETSEQAVMKKLLRTPQLSDPDAELRRFEREIRMQSRLKHEGIMPVLAIGTHSGVPVYVMPKAEKTLADEIALHAGGMPIGVTAAIFWDIAMAVEYAHQQGVYHRDLKPPNVLMVNGKWKLGDFGLCRDIHSNSTTFTQVNSIVGTVAYMAPEQYDDGHAVGPQADVYSIGRILYHMLTGKSPFPYSRIDRLPVEFRYLYAKAVAEEPSERYPTVSELAREFAMIVVGDDSLTVPIERAKNLLTAVLRLESGAAQDLLALITRNADDEVFFSQFVSRLPPPAIAMLQQANSPAFASVVRTFDRYTDGSQPFNYVDVVADFFANIFSLSVDPMLRSLALRKIMKIGAGHNRFYVGEVFARLIAGLKNPQDVLLALNVMREDPAALGWYRNYLVQHSLPDEVKQILNQVG